MKPRIALLFLLLLALPLTGFSQSTLNFPRLFSPSELQLTGFALVNPGPTTATVTFDLFPASGGSPILSKTETIPARGQFSKLGSSSGTGEIFQNVATAGWVRATSTTTGLQGFWLGGDFTNFMDGAEAAPGAPELIFPLATSTTEINVANLATFTASSGAVTPISNTITVRLYSGTGTELGSALPPTLAANGVYRNTLANLFPSADFNNAKYARVTGTGAMAGTSVAVDFIYGPSWSVINGINATTGVMEANFPHVPSGPENGGAKWNSVVGITNLSTTGQTVTLTFNRVSGSPVSVTRNLAGRASIRETAKDLFGFGTNGEEGWVKATGTAPFGGFIAYGYSATGGVAVVPIQPVPYTNLIFAHVATGPAWATGLALLNATTADATVEVYIMRKSGALVGGAADTLTAAFTLTAGTKIARLLNELVPSTTADDGFVYVRSTNNVPLYAFQLFYSRSASQGDAKVLSNVAAATVDSSITFTPPPPAAPLPTPTIAALNPTSTSLLATISISGTNFSATPSANSVVFTSATGSVAATPGTASATTLSVVVPATAISGPVYVAVGGRFSNSAVLSLSSNGVNLITSNVTVTTGGNTLADIYVPPPVSSTPINLVALGITNVGDGSVSLSAAPVEVQSGSSTVNKWLAVLGDGVTTATTVSISGPGVTVTPTGATIPATSFPPGIIVQISVPAGVTIGPRNIIVKNANLDTSVFAGGLVIR